MTNLIGSLKVENSNFKSLSFFTKKKDDGVFDLVCEIGEISIQNNPKLEDVSILEDFGIWGDSSLDECPIRIQNNSKLDTSKICEMERFQEWISLSISGNFKDCVEKRKKFKENYVIDLSNNSEMTHFGLERMHEIYTAQSDVTTINLENLHPEFCLTFDEVFILLTLKIKFRNIHAKFCENFESTNKKKGLKVCKFDQMEILEFDCEFLFGNVVVDTYNGRHLSNLYNVMVIFGSLKIQYTKLEGLSFLNNLRYIANLNESHPTIFIRSNRYLKQAKLPNLEHVISKNQDSVVISDNAELFSNNQECLMYRITYKTNLKVKNEQCDRSIYKTSLSASNFSPFLLFFLYF
ncbi:Protein CBG26179 [Caenorhabditis briggsae]|uniref:Protein CBG26179 n=1 Tax=Caenorhabditis briggsae TaxID=6238 RepID=B6ILB5_CAEBR|nr:Protein CBG26179 [Caenorhabditis briggsae]CAS00695.1 Protein CBG26179 [Caenorhabditis briggsae]